MQDRVPLYPGRVTLTPVAGQENTFDMARADQPTQEGTPLNKATLLKDTTAAKFGKDTGAVPDEVLDVLSKSILEGTYPVVDVYAGQNWQKGSATGSVTSVNVHQIIQFVNGMFFSFPTEANAVYGIKSQDGKTWTQFKVPPEVSGAYIGAHKLLYVNGVYYLMATRPTQSVVFYSSADLETWEKVSELTTTYTAYPVFYSVFLQKFIVIEVQGKTYLSDDLITWSNPYSLGRATSHLNSGANGIDGPDGFYIATSVNKTVSVVRLTASSFNTVFSAETSTAAVSDASLIRFKGKYFVYSAFVVMQSDDLRNWETSSPTYLNSTTVTQQIAYSDNCVLIKYGTSTYVALDGLNFESFVNDGVAAQSSSMAYGNGVFVFHNQATVARLLIYYTPDTTFKDEPGLVDVLGNMVNIPLKQIAGAASIETGTYTGTGGYGSSHSRSLVFAKKPIIVFVFQIEAMTNNYDGGLCILFPSAGKMAIYGTNSFTTSENIFSAQDLIVSASGSNITLKWTPVRDIYVGAMCNKAKKYAYAAFFSEEG